MSTTAEQVARYLDSIEGDEQWHSICDAALARANPKLEALGSLNGVNLYDKHGNFVGCAYFVYYAEIVKEVVDRAMAVD